MNELTIFDMCMDALDVYSYAVMRHYIDPKRNTSRHIVERELSYENALISLKKYQRSHVTRDKESGSYFYLVKYVKTKNDHDPWMLPYDGIKVCI